VKQASRARKIFDWFLGISLLLLGVAGLVLPGLQGILLILAGLAVLSSHSPLARRIQDALKSRLQKVRDRVAKRGGE
jgi:drug/metabolite transporter (DMT)-like permease